MEQIEVTKESKIGDPNNTSLFRVLTSEQKICFPILQDQVVHKQWIQSKNGGIDPVDVIYVMGENRISHLILPTLRRHKTAVFMIVWITYSLFWILYYYYPAWKHVI
jgi:hypothetical protein